ncbi:MAG TPA: hypothetical protein VNO33_14830, partial [Kofleriaceae bacterium]|nr:hypothetical protein [Kofleriaceae bacterium]
MPTMRDAARIAAIVFLVLAAGGGAAEAKTERTALYSFEQVWPTAVRHLRVEEGFTIVEKDVDVGYVVFEVKEEGKTFAGALELVRQKEASGRSSVRLVLRIGERPAYMEAGVLDRLLTKLRQEHGDPPPIEQPPAKKKK